MALAPSLFPKLGHTVGNVTPTDQPLLPDEPNEEPETEKLGASTTQESDPALPNPKPVQELPSTLCDVVKSTSSVCKKSIETKTFCPVWDQNGVSDPDAADNNLLIGYFNGKKVFYHITRTEKALGDAMLKTAVGLTYQIRPPVSWRLSPITGNLAKEPERSAESDKQEEVPQASPSPPASPPCPSGQPQLRSPSHSEGSTETNESSTSCPSWCAREPPILQDGPLFSNEYFETKKSATGGWGSFAVKDLKFGNHILVEKVLLRSDCMNILRDYARMGLAEKMTYMSLHAWHPSNQVHTVHAIFNANAFSSQKKSAIFPIASRFNHACTPHNNVKFRIDDVRDVIVLSVVKDVAAGAELFISYGSDPINLALQYGFVCSCAGCGPVKALERMVWV